MKLLSKDLVTTEYPDKLNADLLKAKVCRFLVAYVSKAGIGELQPGIGSALRDTRSFGVASISCCCGYEPLLGLQSSFPDLRLKYFMDPKESKPGEPDDITLLHSKLVYLFLEEEQKSVVYIGSHNWTRPALGPSGLRNSEASLRVEFDFAPEHLAGIGSSIPSQANGHLLKAWSLDACLPATEKYRLSFEGWYADECQAAPSTPLEDSIVLLAVRSSTTPLSPRDYEELEGKGFYVQAVSEDEGHLIWRNRNRIFVMVWDSESELRDGQAPVIFRCRVSTNKAGPDSAERGTNQSKAPISGFKTVIWDERQITAHASGRNDRRPPVQIWSGREVEVFDFDFPLSRRSSSDAYDAAQPRYQYYLEVETVAFPADGRTPDSPRFVWQPESFGVAGKRSEAKLAKPPGFYVEPDEEARIKQCYQKVFGVQLERARILPSSKVDDPKFGKRIASHPLQETFMGMKRHAKPEEFYSKSQKGATVPDLELISAGGTRDGRVRRAQKVVTSPWKKLLLEWAEIARGYSA